MKEQPTNLTRAELERGVAEAVSRTLERTIAERREERQAEIAEAVSAGVARALANVEHTERKEALQAAFKELMHDQLARFGGWSLAAIGTVVVGLLIYGALYLIGIKAGWTPPAR
jgi:hypothetical protein